MAKYRLTKRAVHDLTEIWNYTFENWSENQADQYYRMLIDYCADLASNPDFGMNYSIVTEKLLGFRAGRHIIFYRELEAEEIEIVRILHEQMDLKSRLNDK